MKRFIALAMTAGVALGADIIYKYVEDEDGLVGKLPVGEATQTALNLKATKVTGGTEDNLTALDAEGNIKDSGRATPDQDLRTTDSVEFVGLTSTGNSVIYETTVNSSNVTATTWYDATNQVMRITEVITAP